MTLPRDLAGFRDRHQGETLLVCGCGSSLAKLPRPVPCTTIGVNDVGRLFDPTYLVVLNPRSQFTGDRFRHVETSRAQAVFTQLDLGLRHPNLVRFRLGKRGGTDLSDPSSLPYTRNSTYVATALALHLGAKRIGLIGVDFTDHHFFAKTGRHPLAATLAQIDREYAALARAAAAMGVELVNLSAESRLSALPKVALESFLGQTPAPQPAPAPPRVFFVHYRFLACGDVFTTGLEHAAHTLGIPAEHAYWDDPRLTGKIAAFRPDLLFVVHGRRFAQRYRGRFPGLKKAVWLLDEPYEVDDTARWSREFDAVFLNDPATLARHANARYLPVAFCPRLHAPADGERAHALGFIGGGNPSREQALLALAEADLLSYVVGGPWRSPRLRALCRAGNVAPAETARLYRDTRLVLNVFRDRHHYNREAIAAGSLNPRVYEALACGALVLSERRPELAEVFPELPSFERWDELPELAHALLADDTHRAELLARGRERLAGHSYADRLQSVLRTLFEPAREPAPAPAVTTAAAEGPELTVLINVRVCPSEPERLRNTRAALQALGEQDLERSRYRIVVVEQDAEPRLEGELGPLVDRYLFAPNPGPYNTGWGFNVGAVVAAPPEGVLCLLDADMLVARDFLARGLAASSRGARVVLPYTEVIYLTPEASQTALRWRFEGPPAAFAEAAKLAGRRFRDSNGGARFIDAAFYREIGGHDERFRGWGCEDRDLWRRLTALARVVTLPGTLLHLHHPRPAENGADAKANERLWDQIRRRPPLARVGAGETMGRLDRYAAELRASALPGRRPWELWHRWEPRAIEGLVTGERHDPPGRSTRRSLAQLVVQLGETLLDVGCGPGALWPHLEPHRARLRWEGLDATPEMLAVARRCFPEVPLHHGDAADLPFEDDVFEVVLLRHVLDHLPPELLPRVLEEAMRVAAKAVVLGFWVPPTPDGERETRRVGAGFLETRWRAAEILAPVERAGWHLEQRLPLCSREGAEEVWLLGPRGTELPPLELETAGEGLKVSIVMPTYRRPHRLPQTLASVVAQTHRHWELILVDNAGDLELGELDPRIRLVRHAERASAAWARNQGLAYATGELVCFFDDDDDMFPTYLESFVEAFAAHPRAQMVRCGMVLCNGRINYSYATPECCLRRAHATPSWRAEGILQDQRYYQRIVRAHRWSERGGEILTLRLPLCRANGDPLGGLRAGGY